MVPRFTVLHNVISRVISGALRGGGSQGEPRQTAFSLSVVDDLIVNVVGCIPTTTIRAPATGPAPGCHWTTALDLLEAGEVDLLRLPVEGLLSRGEAFSIFARATDGCVYRISGATFSRQALLRFQRLTDSEIQLFSELTSARAAQREAEQLIHAFARAPSRLRFWAPRKTPPSPLQPRLQPVSGI